MQNVYLLNVSNFVFIYLEEIKTDVPLFYVSNFHYLYFRLHESIFYFNPFLLFLFFEFTNFIHILFYFIIRKFCILFSSILSDLYH